MNRTLKHGLPLLAVGQAQKEVSHNEALIMIDQWLHLAVESRQLTSPPDAPIAGAAYIIPADSAGSWAGASGGVASFDGFGWNILSPKRGSLVWIFDERCFAVFDGGWTIVGWSPRS